eukprot:TRINITY_DN17859_c0_g4_i1.p1 TRINITY_DN17859_c0_g4~~TRINITY_DN17859_c0_g4_i1.p1  ORF type:complete len:360 (+),score=75.67 TRINITY_DN17859_c0_g4_i1:36-1115(+)
MATSLDRARVSIDAGNNSLQCAGTPANSESGALAQTLRLQALQLSEELNDLQNEHSAQVANADACLSELRADAQTLLDRLTAEARLTCSAFEGMVHRDVLSGDPAAITLSRRRARLEEEVHSLERRAEDLQAAAGREGGVLGASWMVSVTERRTLLQERIDRAESSCASAEARAEASRLEGEARLNELQEMRQALQAEAEEVACNDRRWRGRFEALITEQNAAADRAYESLGPSDPGGPLLERSLAAAAAAAQEGARDPTASKSSIERLAGAARCVFGIAEAERRRRALLVNAWRWAQGEDVQTGRGHACGELPPCDRAFSPPRDRDWEFGCNGGRNRDWEFGVNGGHELGAIGRNGIL